MDPSQFDEEPDGGGELPVIPNDFHLQIRTGSNHLTDWFEELDVYSNGYVKMVRGTRIDPSSHRWFRVFWNEQTVKSVLDLVDRHGLEHARSVQRERIDGDHLHVVATGESRYIDVFVDGEFEKHVCPFVAGLNELLPDTMRIHYSYLDRPPEEPR